jgi:integrase
MLLTGARKSNVLAMRWEDIDLSRGVWTIPADKSKSGKEMSIPLVPAAHALLMERRQASEAYAARKTRKHPKPTEVSPWVFPGRHDVGHLSSVKGHWKSLLKTAGLHNVWMHDLRRTLGSWLAAAGGSEYIIGKALGHSDPSATKVYARLHLDAVRQHMTAVTEAMITLTKKRLL